MGLLFKKRKKVWTEKYFVLEVSHTHTHTYTHTHTHTHTPIVSDSKARVLIVRAPCCRIMTTRRIFSTPRTCRKDASSYGQGEVELYCINRKHDLLVTLMLGSLGEGEGAGKLSGDAFICRLRMIAVALIGVLPPLTLTPIH